MKENTFPFGEHDERRLLASEWAYMQVCTSYLEHYRECERCSSIDGLCGQGTELSETCSTLREKLASECVFLDEDNRLFDRYRAWRKRG